MKAKRKKASRLKGYDNIFACNLRKLMEQNNITQAELAKNAGCSRQAVSQYMDGSSVPIVDKLLGIADYFGVSIDYILGRENKTNKNDSSVMQMQKTVERLLTVGEFVEIYHHGFIEAHSSYDGKKLFSSTKGKNYERYKNCQITSIWSEIRAGKALGFSQIAHPVTCLHISDYDLRMEEKINA